MSQKTLSSKKYRVNFDSSKYDILIGKDLLTSNLVEILSEKTKNRKILLVFDSFFKDKVSKNLAASLSKEGYDVYFYAMESGKHNKTISEAIKIYELLEVSGFSRDSTIIALGGGVIGDLAGFVASTYHRGINLAHIPTTLTAMIDSSIGGKVAINFRKTINAIGNYYHPIVNIVDLDFIESLSQRDFKAGLAEIIKCSFICDKDFFSYLKANSAQILKRQEEVLFYIMCRTIEIKLEHVTGDVKEQAKRLKLNYGHTLGHAIEISTDAFHEAYRHGEGVSLGMVAAAHLAKQYLGCDETVLRAHEEILKQYGLPVRVETEKISFDRDDLIKECVLNINKDKKKKDNKLRFVLPREIGSCQVYDDIDEDFINKTFDYIIK